jgi:molybdopterin-guanine dinucleotide biosynthesis protein MobB
MRPPCIRVAFVGPHNSGKTGLVLRLTTRAAKAGLQVGVLKRAARPIQFDTPGKDSDLFARAGARRVLTSGPGMLFLNEPGHEYKGASALIRQFGAGTDLWLMESYVRESIAWFRVARRGQSAPDPDRFCVATIGARVPDSARPHFRLDRPGSILKFILDMKP